MLLLSFFTSLSFFILSFFSICLLLQLFFPHLLVLASIYIPLFSFFSLTQTHLPLFSPLSGLAFFSYPTFGFHHPLFSFSIAVIGPHSSYNLCSLLFPLINLSCSFTIFIALFFLSISSRSPFAFSHARHFFPQLICEAGPVSTLKDTRVSSVPFSLYFIVHTE